MMNRAWHFPLRSGWMMGMIILAACASVPGKDNDVGIWKPTTLIGVTLRARAIAVGPQGDIWAVLPRTSEGKRPLVRSADRGATWTTITLQLITQDTYYCDVLVVDREDCAWAYTTAWGLSRFSPNGDILTTTGLSQSPPPGYPTLLVASPDGYVYKIGLGIGLTRIGMNGEMRTTWPDIGGMMTFDLAVDAHGDLFALGAHLCRSKDGGLTWERLYHGDVSEPLDLICLESDGTIYILDLRRIFRSTDSGKTWTNLPVLCETRQGELYGLPDGSLAGAVWRTPRDAFPHPYGLFRSWDKGNTWEEWVPGIAKEDIEYGGVLATYGDRIVYAYFQFVAGKESQSGLYRMVLPQRAGADKAWLKY